MTLKERAVVERWPTYGQRGTTWLAHHDECGWCEELTAWHNAFWAADHHMRHDCGRREPSSGDMTSAVHRQIERRYMSDEEYAQYRDDAAAMAEWVERQASNPLYDYLTSGTTAHEGGVQEDPTPTPDEDPTVELGTIATDPCWGLPIEGQGCQSGAGTGWWRGMRGGWGRGR
jgi:hypothetical protein